MSLEMWKIAEAEWVPVHEGSTCVIAMRSAGVEGRITHGKHSSEHERPDRVRQIGLWRGRAARRCRSRHPS